MLEVYAWALGFILLACVLGSLWVLFLFWCIDRYFDRRRDRRLEQWLQQWGMW